MRSFHATIESGAESMCESLGLSNAQVEVGTLFLCLSLTPLAVCFLRLIFSAFGEQ